MDRFFPITFAGAAALVTGAKLLVDLSEVPTTRPSPPEPEALPAPATKITSCPEQLEALPAPFRTDPRAAHGDLIVVFKHAELVGFYRDGTLVSDAMGPVCATVSMGDWPFEPKFRYDNMSTPEGWYTVRAKRTSDPNDAFPPTSFYKSLQIGYPNAVDVSLALERGVIDQTLADQFQAMISQGILPPQNSPMGGDVTIHGWAATEKVPTAGCVGVDDENIDRLFVLANVGTSILSLPWRWAVYTDHSSVWVEELPLTEPPSMMVDPSLIESTYTIGDRTVILMKPMTIVGDTE